MKKEIIGTSNRIIEINLSTKEHKIIHVESRDRALYLGGKGLGLKLLYDRLKPGVDPLGEENILALTTGVYMGTGATNSARFSAVTKSPLTGIMLSSSCGGPFGMALKTAGYDGLLISGKAKNLCKLIISENDIEIIESNDLAGKNTEETQQLLNLGSKEGALVIGPAGENTVKFANAVSGTRYLGRGGIGAVMGSKNLKAIVAKGGIYKIVPTDSEKFDRTKKKSTKYINDNFVTSKNYRDYGTNSHVLLCNKANILPVRNFTSGSHEKATEVSGEMFKIKHNQKYSVCKPCTILCGHKGTFGDKEKHIPEYESTALLGPNLEIFDTQKIAELNEACNSLGLDTISVGTLLSYIAEATEKGHFKTNCKFGEFDGFMEMINLIAHRKGFGDEAAEGVRKLSEKYGGKDFAIQVKGMEMSAYDPRGSWGQGLAYAVANRGACHLSAPVFSLEATLAYLKADTSMSKAYVTNYFEKLFAAVNSLHGCQFTSFAYMLEPLVAKYTPKKILGKAIQFTPAAALALMDVSVYSDVFEAITGIELSQSQMLKAGERIHALERYMNTREGVSKKDDTLPSRLLNEKLKTGNSDKKIPLEEMLNKYYKLKGFDSNGIPEEKTLKRLKIEIK